MSYNFFEILKKNIGEAGKFFDRDDVTELMLNCDGRVWIDSFSGQFDTGLKIPPNQSDKIIRLISSSIQEETTRRRPLLQAEFPSEGHRVQAFIPPVVQQPAFIIRKKASQLFTLNDYEQQGAFDFKKDEDIENTTNKFHYDKDVRTRLNNAVKAKKNILISGATGSGKTTFLNAILAEIALVESDSRLILIEDTQELQCACQNKLFLRSKDGVASMADLLKATLRSRPDRIIVGEVRDGAAASTMLKAWNTGHPGGCCSIHANSASEAITRMHHLLMEVFSSVPEGFVESVIDTIIHIQRTANGKRKITEIKDVE